MRTISQPADWQGSDGLDRFTFFMRVKNWKPEQTEGKRPEDSKRWKAKVQHKPRLTARARQKAVTDQKQNINRKQQPDWKHGTDRKQDMGSKRQGQMETDWGCPLRQVSGSSSEDTISKEMVLCHAAHTNMLATILLGCITGLWQ